MQIFLTAFFSLCLGIGIGGIFQCWLGFRPQGWKAMNGKRFRNVEIGDRP
jgi:hypothetical protein